MNLSPQEAGAELTLGNISVKRIKSIINDLYSDCSPTNTGHVDLCEAARVNVRTTFVITVVNTLHHLSSYVKQLHSITKYITVNDPWRGLTAEEGMLSVCLYMRVGDITA